MKLPTMVEDARNGQKEETMKIYQGDDLDAGRKLKSAKRRQAQISNTSEYGLCPFRLHSFQPFFLRPSVLVNAFQ